MDDNYQIKRRAVPLPYDDTPAPEPEGDAQQQTGEPS